MVAIGILGILIDRLFIAVERRWFSWRHTTDEAGT